VTTILRRLLGWPMPHANVWEHDARAQLGRVHDVLDPAARRVLERHARRLLMGQNGYRSDFGRGRRFWAEALDELCDGSIYLEVELERARAIWGDELRVLAVTEVCKRFLETPLAAVRVTPEEIARREQVARFVAAVVGEGIAA